MAFINKTTPRTSPIFPIFEPITFPKAISGKPSKAALILTIISGAEVANETTVKPTIIFEMLSLNESPTDDFKSQFPPITRSNSPITINTKSI